MNYNIKAFSDHGKVSINDYKVKFTADKDYNEAFFGDLIYKYGLDW